MRPCLCLVSLVLVACQAGTEMPSASGAVQEAVVLLQSTEYMATIGHRNLDLTAEVAAFSAVLRSDVAAEQFLSLARSESIAPATYGLVGLFLVDRPSYYAEWAPFAKRFGSDVYLAALDDCHVVYLSTTDIIQGIADGTLPGVLLVQEWELQDR